MLKYVLYSVGGDGATFTTETALAVFSDKKLAQKVAGALDSMRGKKRSKVSKDLTFGVRGVMEITDGAGSDPNLYAKLIADQGMCE